MGLVHIPLHTRFGVPGSPKCNVFYANYFPSFRCRVIYKFQFDAVSTKETLSLLSRPRLVLVMPRLGIAPACGCSHALVVVIVLDWARSSMPIFSLTLQPGILASTLNTLQYHHNIHSDRSAARSGSI